MANSDTPLLHLPAEFIDLCRERMVLAGFSGGTDSTAMLLLLKESGLDVTAVHFEHGLRGRESIEDALWAEDFAGRHSIPFRRIDLHVDTAGSVEAKARDARLEAWCTLTAPDGAFPGAAVALAHHRDDAVETMLERIARGGNVSSLASLRMRRKIRGVEFFRPLLGFSRKMLEEYLAAKGVTGCRFDSSNSSNDYFRNHIRNNILPCWQEGYSFVNGGLAASLRALWLDSEFLEAEAEKLWQRRPGKEEGINKIAAQWFRELPGAMKFRIAGIFFRSSRVSEENIASVLARMENAAGSIPINNHFELQMVRGFWKIRQKSVQPVLWNWQQEQAVEFDGDIYRVRMAEAPSFNEGLPSGDDAPGVNRVWFPAALLPETLELSLERRNRTLRRTAASLPEPVKSFKAPDAVMSVPGEDEVLWLAGVRRTGVLPVSGGELCAVFERFPRK